jgi:hypothetical protein
VAKKRTQALFDMRSKYESRNSIQGIGYYVPPHIPLDKWKKLCKKWTRILQTSGHDDIEQFSSDCTGHFSSFFFKTNKNQSLSGSAATVARLYKPANEYFYRRLRLFYHHGDLRRRSYFKTALKLLPDMPANARYTLLKNFLRLRMDGATHQAITNWLRKEAPKTCRQKRSIWWVYYRIMFIEKQAELWAKQNPEMME